MVLHKRELIWLKNSCYSQVLESVWQTMMDPHIPQFVYGIGSDFGQQQPHPGETFVEY